MITFWAIEAMFRVSDINLIQNKNKKIFSNILSNQASKYTKYLPSEPHGPNIRKTAIAHFDNVLSFANHLGIFSEEVAVSGEAMGNVPQAFSHLACVSAAMNLAGSGD